MAKNKKKRSSPLSNRIIFLIIVLIAGFAAFLYSQNKTGILGVTERDGGGSFVTKPTTKPSPTVCRDGAVEKFVLSTTCGINKFSSGFYQCKSGLNYQESGCKEVSQWYSIASKKCSATCKNIQKTTPQPTR